MSLIVEDGTGLANAESYVSAADCATYAANRGLAFSIADVPAAEAALRRATIFIETYRFRFPGYRTHRRAQALEWPRSGAYADLPQTMDDDVRSPYRGQIYNPGYDYILNNVVPVEIVNATCEAAIRELAAPGTMQPDLKRGGAIQSVRAGSVEVVYSAMADARTTFQIINGILAPLLITGSGGGLFGRAMRA